MTPANLPSSIGRYVIRERLGRGAVGEVYLAHDPLLDRQVAIKVLSILEALPADEQAEARARFGREARAAARLSHPSIVTIHDVGEHQGQPFLAMEYLRGVTLDRHTRAEHRLPPGVVLRCGQQAALALAEAHAAGIVHRDIKPANLILLDDGTLKVADFGLAKDPRTSLTSEQSLLGTPNYMSPEQIAGTALDGRSDLFSLATSLFELLSGQRPFGGESISSVLYRIVNDPPRTLRELSPDCPIEWEQFFERALSKRPDDRFPDGVAFAAALDPLRVAITGDLPMPPPAPRTAAGSLVAARTGSNPEDETVQHRSGMRSQPALDAGRSRITPRPRSRRRWWIAALIPLAAAGLWWAPSWSGWDPLGSRRAPVDRWLSARFGAIGDLLRITPAERIVPIETVPAGLALRLVGPGRIEAGRWIAPLRGEDAATLQIDDPCWRGETSATPATAPAELRIVAQPILESIAIASDPSGAAIDLDGTAAAVTPASLDLPLCVPHRVIVSREGHVPATFELAERDVEAWRRTLGAVRLAVAELPTGTIRLPKPASYQLQVEDQGGRRLAVGGGSFVLPVGRHRLTLRAPEILWSEAITLEVAAGAATLAQNLPAVGTLAVLAVPPGGSVTIQRRGASAVEIGTTPLAARPIAAGEYTITVTHPDGNGRASRTLTIAAGDATSVKIGKDQWR